MKGKRKIRLHYSFLVLWIGICCFTGMAQEKDFLHEEMRQEIRCLNLINGLDLREEQAKLILENARAAESLRQEFKMFLSSRMQELRESLEEVRTCLRDNNEVPQSLAQRYHQVSNGIQKTKSEMDEQIKNLALEIESHLKDHQVFALEKYVPCVIPPKGDSRIGQAEDHKAMTRGLERIRSIPSRLYQRRKQTIVHRTFEAMKIKTPHGAYLDEDKMIKDILSIYDKARRMDEPEFEIQKESLAQELHGLIKPRGDYQNVSRKVERFLLAKEIIPVLEGRLLSKGYTEGR